MSLRVAYIITRGDDLGGAQIHVRDLSTALIARGGCAMVFAGGEGVLAAELGDRDVPHETVPRMVRPISPRDDASAIAFLRRRLKAFNPHLVSTHSSKAGIVGRVAAWSLGIPRIHTAHGWAFSEGRPDRERKMGERVERAIARITGKIITVCDVDRDLAIERKVVSADRIVTIHNAVVDGPPEDRASPADGPPRLVMTARFDAQKDHRTLFEALAGLTELDWRLDLIGAGPELEQTRSLAESMALTDRVSFLGLRRDVADRLARAQGFVLASNWEGFPRSILEAMRAGLPVVASDVGGIRESVTDGVTGFVVPPGDVDSLRVRLATLLSDPELRARLGAAGRARYERSFRFDGLVDRTLDVYRGVVKPAGARALAGLDLGS